VAVRAAISGAGAPVRSRFAGQGRCGEAIGRGGAKDLARRSAAGRIAGGSRQRKNPTRSVWVEVNEEAVADCTGPNGKPTVAQFCAFAIMEDGRRVKTANSTDNPYCDRLFRDWSAERVS
jgi:hypothetical protein